MGFYPALLPVAALLIAAPDTGQNPPPPPDQTLIALKEVAERMTVPVSIAGAGPYRFVIDTGAERTVISRQLATTLGLSRGSDVNVVAMSGVSRVGTVVIPSLRPVERARDRTDQRPRAGRRRSRRDGACSASTRCRTTRSRSISRLGR